MIARPGIYVRARRVIPLPRRFCETFGGHRLTLGGALVVLFLRLPIYLLLRLLRRR